MQSRKPQVPDQGLSWGKTGLVRLTLVCKAVEQCSSPQEGQAPGVAGWTEVREPGLCFRGKAEDFPNSRGQIYLPIPRRADSSVCLEMSARVVGGTQGEFSSK